MINVVGLGPGEKNYILPIAIDTIKKCSMIIGGKRNLEIVENYCTRIMDLSIGFSKIADYLVQNSDEEIGVVVSGDSGFYSLLNFVKRHVEDKYINVIPGISSLQYLYSKLKKGYENCKLLSLHGREQDIKEYLENRVELGILTDKEHNNRFIAQKIIDWSFTNVKITIGEKLSYLDEKITTLNLEEAVKYIAEDLSVVVITYE